MFLRVSPKRSDLPLKPASYQQESFVDNQHNNRNLENQSGDNTVPKKPKILEADVVLTLDFDHNSDLNSEEEKKEFEILK